MTKPVERNVRSFAPTPAIRLGGRDRSESARHALWLAVFMRSVAVLWIVEGLAQWAEILTDDSGAIIGAASALHVTAQFFFCVLDLVAAVGLWLVTAWGGAVWIATIIGHVLTVIFAPGFLGEPTLMLAGDAIMVGSYATLSWFSGRQA